MFKNPVCPILLFAMSSLIVACAAPSEDIFAYEEWDLVWISDSTGFGAAEVYAEYIQEDLGLTVNIHNYTVHGLSAGTALKALRGEEGIQYTLQELPEVIPEAEVVVFYANPIRSKSDKHPFDWDCTSNRPYVNKCAPETFEVYREHLDTVYREIFALRGRKPILIRAYEPYNIPAHWDEHGVLDECLQCWANYTQVIHDAADAHGIPVANVYDAFTGAQHDSDPRNTGLIGSDGQHTTPEGARLIADLLRELGYDVTQP